MPHPLSRSVVVQCASCGLLILNLICGIAVAQATLERDQRAALILNSARQAYNQGQYEYAAQRFDEYLREFGGDKAASSARYGWALCLLEGPPQGDVQAPLRKAFDLLNAPANDQNFADRPFAVYFQGVALRALGNDYLRLAQERPNEAPQRRNEARAQFEQALPRFSEAVKGFETLASQAAGESVPDATDELPPSQQWVARTRCDQAEMLLRLERFKDVAEVTAPLVDKQGRLAKSRFRPTALYHHGYAAFRQEDYVTAGQSLSQLAPFTDPVFGTHTKYLLARTHHLHGERAEAAALYAAILTGFEQERADAQRLLGNAEALKGKPEERRRLEALLKTRPDYVGRSNFYWGVLLYEQEKFSDALERFTALTKENPPSPLADEAQLRQGMCQVQLKQLAEAIKTLAPLANHASLSDRALLWLARAEIRSADPANQQQLQQLVSAAVNHLRQSEERARGLASRDEQALKRRVEILLELGDAQQLAGQFNDAANWYETIRREKHDPQRLEEATQRLATVMHLAGRFDDADRVCQEFRQAWPQSTLLPAVLFRFAENAFLRAAAIDPGKPIADSPLRKQWLQEALKRYQPVIEDYPDFQYVPLALYRVGLAHAQLSDDKAAIESLAKIQAADRQGELVAASYHLADALLRTLPEASPDDALSAGRLVQQIGEATKLLEGFISAQEGQPQKRVELPDALLKLGYCYRQSAALIAKPEERNQMLAQARQAYERIMNQFGSHPRAADAVFQRALCNVEQGDVNGAMNELNRFRGDPLRQSPVAPLALLRYASLLEAQGKPQDAANLLAECRQQHEGALRNDKNRIAWVPLIWYHHGTALQAAGKLAEARSVFESIRQQFAASVQAPNAAWRSGQCQKEEALLRLEPARALRDKPESTPEQLAQARNDIAASVTQLKQAGDYLRDRANETGQAAAGSPAHLRQLYESAWCYRLVGQEESYAAGQQMAEQQRQKRQEELKARGGKTELPVPIAHLPNISAKAIPLQSYEQAARTQYTALIEAAYDDVLALHAQLELAEMNAKREEYEPAVALLVDALDREPPAELEQRLRLRMGDCLLSQGDAEGARDQLVAIATIENSPLAPEARYRAGECFIALKDWPKAIEQLKPFRDHGPLQNITQLSDRALLRLGYAFAQAGNWNECRQSYETLLGRFPRSPWRFEARYGVGWAWQNQNQYDGAVGQYEQVVRETATEVAARAQLQAGLCRMAQKRYPEATKALLSVFSTYDYPQWNAAALFEAARAYGEMQEPEEARKALERLLNDYPDTEWAKSARQKLAQL